jgi:hypothetical protein
VHYASALNTNAWPSIRKSRRRAPSHRDTVRFGFRLPVTGRPSSSPRAKPSPTPAPRASTDHQANQASRLRLYKHEQLPAQHHAPHPARLNATRGGSVNQATPLKYGEPSKPTAGRREGRATRIPTAEPPQTDAEQHGAAPTGAQCGPVQQCCGRPASTASHVLICRAARRRVVPQVVVRAHSRRWSGACPRSASATIPRQLLGGTCVTVIHGLP